MAKCIAVGYGSAVTVLQDTRADDETGTRWALTQWLSWLECHPVCQKAVASIPGPGSHLGCVFDSQSGAYGKHLIIVSLSLPLLPLTPFLPKISKHVLR